MINGNKIWISHAKVADFATVFVRTDDGPIGIRGEITCFIVETGTPGYTISNPIPVIRPEAPYELIFEDCLVPENQMLGERGRGFDLLKSLHPKSHPLCRAMRGGGQESLEMAVEYSRIWRLLVNLFPNGRPCSGSLPIPRWNCMRPDWSFTMPPAAGRKNKPFEIQFSMAKLMASEVAMQVVDRAIQIHGGMGLAKELPLERWYREFEDPSHRRRTFRGPQYGDFQGNDILKIGLRFNACGQAGGLGFI